MARTSKRRLLEGLLHPPGDMVEAERPPTPRWIAQRDEILATGAWDDEEPAPLFERFELLATLGHGGYGCVFKARDPDLDRIVAIKRCKSEHPLATEALVSEARTVAQLTHENIITVHQIGRDGDDVFFVMEYVGGGSLDQFACRKHEQPRSWRELVPIFAGAARGLAAAHARGVVHGDFKPANVLLHEDLRPRVADFGLARMVGAPNVEPGAVGTLAYAAREVLAGEACDKRSDQWSFFMALWHCLEGELPLVHPAGDDSLEFWSSEDAVIRALDAWAGPSSLRADVPERLGELVCVGLSLDPAERWPDMSVVAQELTKLAVLAEAPVLEPSEGPPADSGRWERWTSTLIGGLVFMAGVLATLSYAYVPWPWRLASNLDEDSPPSSESAERALSDDEEPCVTDGVPFVPDGNVETVCRTLAAESPGQERAVALWKELRGSREQRAKTAGDWLELASDSAVLAQTFEREALEFETTAEARTREGSLHRTAEQLARHAHDQLREASNLDEDGDGTAAAVSVIGSVADRVLQPELD